jgi:hypothetical protein
MTSATGPNLESMSYGLGGISPRSGPIGARLGESSLLHAALGADVGYDSNVFYSQTPTSATVAHVTPALDLSNGERDGSMPDGAYYDLGASLTYREYLSGGDAIRSQRAFNPSLGALLRVSSRQTLSLLLSDNFSRTEDPPYTEGAKIITHDRNTGSLELKVAPGGGRIQLVLRYNNVLDLYEGLPYTNGNNMGNEGVIDLSWRWLPKTAFFMQVRPGGRDLSEDRAAAERSPPTRCEPRPACAASLTEKLGLNLAAGYSQWLSTAQRWQQSVGLRRHRDLGRRDPLQHDADLEGRAGLPARLPELSHSSATSTIWMPSMRRCREFVGGRVATAAYGSLREPQVPRGSNQWEPLTPRVEPIRW